MVQGVSRRAFTAKALVQTQEIPFGIFAGQSGTGAVYFSEYRSLSLSVSLHERSILVHYSVTETERSC